MKIRGRLTVERLELIWRAFPAAYAWFLYQGGVLPPLAEVLDRQEREAEEARDF